MEEKKPFHMERDFWKGVAIWFVLHWGVSGILPGIAPIMFILTSIMIIFIGTGKYGNKKIAMGMLTAYGVNFLINLMLGLGWNAVCGFPYFLDLGDLILGTL